MEIIEKAFSDIVRNIYALPYEYVIGMIIVSIIVWSMLSLYLFRFKNKGAGRTTKGRRMLKRKASLRRAWRVFNVLFFICSAIIIVSLTLLHRETGGHAQYIIPFYSFIEAKENPEFYRTMLMNVFLFVPFGLSFPYVIRKSAKRKRLRTVLLACFISLTIEIIQFAFNIGRAETDDVIMNTLGALVGTLGFWE